MPPDGLDHMQLEIFGLRAKGVLIAGPRSEEDPRLLSQQFEMQKDAPTNYWVAGKFQASCLVADAYGDQYLYGYWLPAAEVFAIMLSHNGYGSYPMRMSVHPWGEGDFGIVLNWSDNPDIHRALMLDLVGKFQA